MTQNSSVFTDGKNNVHLRENVWTKYVFGHLLTLSFLHCLRLSYTKEFRGRNKIQK
jgi:hypothetical protein